MKKIIIWLLILAAASMLIYQFVVKKQFDEPQVDESKPIVMKNSSPGFTQSYDTLLFAYYALKDALVASDASAADAAAAKLKMAADSIQLNELDSDSTGLIRETATSYIGTINVSVDALLQEKDLEAKRKEFEIISDALWSLTRTVQYQGGTVYYQFCPMAFNNKGAYWLSNSNQIRNPYFGDKMLKCGSTQDSLSY